MKSRKTIESRKSRRSLECLGADDLKRVTGGGPTWEHHDAGVPSADVDERSMSQMFDML
jgi:hypothetical protein